MPWRRKRSACLEGEKRWGRGRRGEKPAAMNLSRCWTLPAMLLVLMQAQACLSLDSQDFRQNLSLKSSNTTSFTYQEATNQNVLVELYSESLCPFCANFIVNYLSRFFDVGLIDIVDLRIIPFGNAHIKPDGSFTCQHGPDECKLNIIQTCAITLWPNVTQWFPFILCLESLPRHKAAQEWTSCLKLSSLVLDRIEECYEGPLGYELERKFAKETLDLKPPHRFVPWVLVNKVPLYEDYESVAKYVCEAYKGPKPLPNVCSSILDIFPRLTKWINWRGVFERMFDKNFLFDKASTR